MQPPAAPTMQSGLADVCAPIFTFAFNMRRASEEYAQEVETEGGYYEGDEPWDNAEELHIHIGKLLSRLDMLASQSDVSRILTRDQLQAHAQRRKRVQAEGRAISPRDIQFVKYALCAFLDELVFMSQLPAREEWTGRPLQLEYFNDYNAGDAFYTKLDELRHTDDPITNAVLEIYYLCLVLGFKGKFTDRVGLEKRKVLVDSLSREIVMARSGESPDMLSPNWEPPASMARRFRSIPLWLIPCICFGIFVITYITLQALIEGNLGSVLDKLPH